MITTLVVFAFFGVLVAWTGPAWDQHREKRRLLLDYPRAKIEPIKACKVCHRTACPWHL